MAIAEALDCKIFAATEKSRVLKTLQVFFSGMEQIRFFGEGANAYKRHLIPQKMRKNFKFGKKLGSVERRSGYVRYVS